MGKELLTTRGEFKITFKAIPDSGADKSSLPIFNYEITADVTDINGETRSATMVVNVGYHALVADISVDDFIDKLNKTNTLKIDTKKPKR